MDAGVTRIYYVNVPVRSVTHTPRGIELTVTGAVRPPHAEEGPACREVLHAVVTHIGDVNVGVARGGNASRAVELAISVAV